MQFNLHDSLFRGLAALMLCGPLSVACSSDGGGGTADDDGSGGGAAGSRAQAGAGGSQGGGAGGQGASGGKGGSSGSAGGMAGNAGTGPGGSGGSAAGGTAGSAAGGTAGSAAGGTAGSAAGGTAGTAGAGGAVMPPMGGGGGAAAAGGQAGSMPPAGGAGGATACKTNAFCDDFESYPVGAFKLANGWTTSDSGASMVIDESKPRNGGKRSMKISVAAAAEGQGMLSRNDRTVLSTGKPIFARMMVYMDAIPSGDGLHWAFMRAVGFHSEGGSSGLLMHNIGGQPGRVRNLLLWPTSKGLQDCFNDSATPIPVKKWTCVEWHLDPEKQAMDVWFDGQRLAGNSWTTRPAGGGCAIDQTGGKWVIPKLSLMHFGWAQYRVHSGVTMWMDDVAMDTKRIGCPAE